MLDELDDRVPHAREAEVAVLGSILVASVGDGHDPMATVLKLMEEDDFLSPRHRTIFAAMRSLHEKRVPPDIVLLKDALVERGELDACGGAAYLGALVEGVPRAGNIVWYVHAVKRASDKRAHMDRLSEELEAAAEPRTEPAPEEHHLTDVGNARRLAERHGGDIRYLADRGTFLVWDGTRWLPESHPVRLMAMAKDTVRAMFREAAEIAEPKGRDALWRHARSSESQRALQAMIALVASEPGIAVSSDALDADRDLLNVANGVLDLRTGELGPHQRRHLMSKLAPVSHDPDATCPTFEAFLARIMDGRADLIGYLQRAVGYSLTGHTTEQTLFMLYGGGANGKTTLLNSLQDLMGDYATQAAPDVLLSRRADEHPTAVADLEGARLVASVEVDEGKHLAENLVKSLTGGDRVKSRKMRQDYSTYVPQFKLFLAVNHKPVIRGTDLAIWRRIRLVPFDVTIPEDKQDQELPGKLRAELPGLLAWAVRGCLAWRSERLGKPPAVVEATAGYRADMDVIGDFLEAECVLGPLHMVMKRALFKSYREWCERSGERPIPQRRLSERLKERGIEAEKTHDGHLWVGIGLLEDARTQGEESLL